MRLNSVRKLPNLLKVHTWLLNDLKGWKYFNYISIYLLLMLPGVCMLTNMDSCFNWFEKYCYSGMGNADFCGIKITVSFHIDWWVFTNNLQDIPALSSELKRLLSSQNSSSIFPQNWWTAAAALKAVIFTVTAMRTDVQLLSFIRCWLEGR